ncbi:MULTISPECIES: hypothetical protein [Leuconostoc]|uniref:Bacteriocin immunity protein n=2 Tax=Leuconostoc kimchii TaxID=136609 RepID=D5T1U2_LEUKI|nr:MULTISPECIES: hypothetical protein [Leuconostoc]ADG40241.1 hypothetical protein LKI_03495 [Leuconostoc kimchii IMSNU 11154]AEJ31819.1 hypothetical protein LGMK_08850 [Leuconostoc sp. C2]QBR46752.1 hypothetical protein EW139_00880 [Leuconostoc kimchii]
MNRKKTQFWQMVNEIATDSSSDISRQEREILAHANQNMEHGIDDIKVAEDLKYKLSEQFITQGRLSATLVPIQSELLRLYLGYGRRDNISL